MRTHAQNKVKENKLHLPLAFAISCVKVIELMQNNERGIEMMDKVYAHGNVIQMSGLNHVIGLMANEKQAEDVVRIINAHDDMVKALKDLIPFVGYMSSATEELKEQAYAALTKAGAA